MLRTALAASALALVLSGCVYVEWARGGAPSYRGPPPAYYAAYDSRSEPYRRW